MLAIKTETIHHNLLNFVRAKEAELINKLPKSVKQKYKKNNMLLNDFFMLFANYAKEHKDIKQKSGRIKKFVYEIGKQKEPLPFEYQALDFYNQELFKAYYTYFLNNKAILRKPPGEFLEDCFKKRLLINPNRETLDYLIEYRDRVSHAKTIRLKATSLCNHSFLKQCRKVKITRKEAIDSLTKFISLFTNQVSEEDAKVYFNAIDQQYLKELY